MNTTRRVRHKLMSHDAMPQRLLLAAFLVAYFVILCVLSVRAPVDKDFFPDEKWRLTLPLYFYEHGSLPTGYEESTRMTPWGFSYASYPLMLSTVLGGILMKIMGLVTSNINWIVFAGRLVCIGAGVVFAYFVIRISALLFDGPISYLFASTVIFLPQIVFCSLYFNNDIIALCGSSMILYSWLLGFKNGWSMRSGILLALGVSVIALSYYNAYSWILMSIFVYFLVWHRSSDSFVSLFQNRRFYRMTFMIIGIVLVLILPFFIRAAIINHGDFLGFSTVSRMSEQYGESNYKPSGRPTPQHLGMSLWGMLTTNHYLGGTNSWLLFTYRSFIGVFGPMKVFLPQIMYILFGLIFAIGVVGCIAGTIFDAVHGAYGKRWYFDAVMLCNMVIVIALALQYSYATDYQAQGRYILPMVLSFMYFVTRGWSYALNAVGAAAKRKELIYLLCGGVIGVECCLVIVSFVAYYLPAVR
ncbi:MULTISPECIES: hypothetical protein [unclassified Bifidobacterium]|uniref:hypothetical protein n=1 Tax=unclassified Bifidobacterium TaxID=2608897 RepID=UPI001129EC3A|nr:MULTISPECIES: hypothetical protein [unclassified Bifidobacterium]